MKEDFDCNQHKEYYNNLRTTYYQFNKRIATTDYTPLQNEKSDSHYYYETSFTRIPIKPLLITDTTLSALLAMSFEHSHILLNENTYYIKDIRDVKDTLFNTIVFQLGTPPLKTKEHSRTIMNRYFSKRPINYQTVQSIGKSLGFHHRCPFVSGYQIFVPEKGSSNDSTSWYGLHHALDAVEDKKGNSIHVYFRDGHELKLLISARSFNEQVERSAKLSFLQQNVIDEIVGLLHFTHTPQFTDELNIVQRRVKASTFLSVLSPIESLINYLTIYRANESLETILGEGNPYIDEIREDFSLSLKFKPTYFHD
ncbi:MAG: competence protein ComK [Carnobacterium sp.]|uniref:competence protein ComK n=1 Tax=Carnobacterium sp. TaxID=48221 RepID=UPI003314E6A7